MASGTDEMLCKSDLAPDTIGIVLNMGPIVEVLFRPTPT